MTIWDGVDRLVDRAPLVGDLRAHGIQLFAARRFRAQGRPIPAELQADEHFARIASVTAPYLLRRLREACDGQIAVFKGVEAARFYPDPILRRFVDVDILVPDAAAAQRALIEVGFREVGYPELYLDIHHLRPLMLPGMPLSVEVHSRPKWLAGLDAPTSAELFEAARPSGLGIDGILALPREHHALVMAAHAWSSEQPFNRISQVVDIAAVAAGADVSLIEQLARTWGVERVWRTSIAVGDALFRDGPKPVALRTWARNLYHARERTVLENHIERWMSNFWTRPLDDALLASAGVLLAELRPEPGETWRKKALRTRRALANSLTRKSAHDRALRQEELAGPDALTRRRLH